MSTTDPHWSESLHLLITSSSNDEEIVEFIENDVPNDENPIFDNKRQAFIHTDNSSKGKDRHFQLLKHISALANTRNKQRHRYLFIGFGDDGSFIGSSDWDADGGRHIVDVDEVRIQNLLSDKLDPMPDVGRRILEYNESKAAILTIERADNPPILFDTTISKNGGQNELVSPGIGYTRKGSQSRKMRNSDYRVIIERRESLINEKIEETLNGLSRMVGISSDQLEDLDINVTSSDEGVPIDEIVSTEGYSDLNKRLSLSVKEWNSSRELYSSRQAVYTMLKRRDELELDDEKCEFLAWSSLNNNIPPTQWVIEHEGEMEESLREFYHEKLNGRMISVFEGTNYILNNRNLLETLAEDEEINYKSSKAEEYVEDLDKSPADKANELASRRNIPIAGHDWSIIDLVESGGPLETAVEEVADRLISDDQANDRGILRTTEYTRLARYIHQS